MSGWPPVSGHPAMVVAIEMQFRRAQERSAWKGSVKGACLLCLRGLIARLAFLLASLSIARLVWGRGGKGRGRGRCGGRGVGVKSIGHGVRVRGVR
jgi:hypothetical protein